VIRGVVSISSRRCAPLDLAPSTTSRRFSSAPVTWLLGCRYADDKMLLDAEDSWQHPCTFELVRSGDCEDYALWAWRQLVRAGYDAEFVVGMLHRRDGVTGRHAWVVFREGNERFVLDGVERTTELMIHTLAHVREMYEPQVAVARDGRRFVYAGLYRTEWGKQLVMMRASGIP
jgi:hypothetical protein